MKEEGNTVRVCWVRRSAIDEGWEVVMCVRQRGESNERSERLHFYYRRSYERE